MFSILVRTQSYTKYSGKAEINKGSVFFPTYVFLLKSFINVECSGIFFISSQSLSVKYMDKILCCLGSYSQEF